MITTEKKLETIEALKVKRSLFSGSDAKFAASLGINTAQYSRIKNGETERVLAENVWISLARFCNVGLSNTPKWENAETPFFKYAITQFQFCQKNSTSRIMVDVADIGKTHSAKYYCSVNKNAIYIDCTQNKTKQKLIKQIAKSFGVNHTGKYSDIYDDLIFYIRQLENPLIILDEAGDLDYGAFLELKALWNATEGFCGWYMMGADGLKEKIRRRIDSKKVGYVEIFSRFGNKYQKPSPDSLQELKEYKMVVAALIIKANFPEGTDINKTMAAADYTLRNLRDERKKIA